MQPEQKLQSLSKLVKGIQETDNSNTIIIDEASLALPDDEDPAAAKPAKAALAQITASTNQNLKASIILISSEHGYPYKLAKANLNLEDIQKVIIAPEVPPRDMLQMLTDQWGLVCLFVATYGQWWLHAGGLQGSGQPHGQSSLRWALHPCRASAILPGKGRLGAGLCLCLPVVKHVHTQNHFAFRRMMRASTATDKEYVLVASTHHVRLRICKARFAGKQGLHKFVALRGALGRGLHPEQRWQTSEGFTELVQGLGTLSGDGPV